MIRFCAGMSVWSESATSIVFPHLAISIASVPFRLLFEIVDITA